MTEKPNSRRKATIIAVILLLIVLLLLLVRCRPTASPAAAQPAAQAPAPAVSAPGAKPADEVLTAATLQFPASVSAGASFAVRWTGPNNERDYLTIVRPDAAAAVYGNYRDTSTGNPVELLAPIEAGNWEVRYVTTRSKTVLGRAPLTVVAHAVTLQAPAEVVAGATLQATWTGPNNAGDYLTLVPKALPDGQYGNYAYTTKGSPLTLTAPIDAGEAELRYVTGQGARVLGRVPVLITVAPITLEAPAAAAAGSKVTIAWQGPNHPGDYLTIVPQTLPDGQYGAYAYTTKGSPLTVDAPKAATVAEIRYVSGQGAKVLKRRPIVITP